MSSEKKIFSEGGFPGQRLLSGLRRLLRHAPEVCGYGYFLSHSLNKRNDVMRIPIIILRLKQTGSVQHQRQDTMCPELWPCRRIHPPAHTITFTLIPSTLSRRPYQEHSHFNYSFPHTIQFLSPLTSLFKYTGPIIHLHRFSLTFIHSFTPSTIH